ncbi:hypothetical protein [Denitratisoma sp. agr-D3]
MTENDQPVPAADTPPTPSNENTTPAAAPETKAQPWRWLWRIALLALFFYLLGYFSNPVTTPLMCKIYG